MKNYRLIFCLWMFFLYPYFASAAAPISTTTTILSQQDPTTTNRIINLFAVISTTGGPATTAIGEVNFIVNGQSIGMAPVQNAIASQPFFATNADNYNIVAQYLGDGVFAPSTSTSFTQVVLSSTASPSNTIINVFGLNNAFQIVVTPVTPTDKIPTGTLTLTTTLNTQFKLQVSLEQGQAIVPFSSLPAINDLLTIFYSGDSFFLESESTIPITASLNPVFPPTNLVGFQRIHCFCHRTDIVNILTWDPPSQGNPPVAYKIFRDASLTKLVGIVPAQNKLKFKIHNRRRNRIYTYFVVSVDGNDNISAPVSVTIHPRHKRCNHSSSSSDR